MGGNGLDFYFWLVCGPGHKKKKQKLVILYFGQGILRQG